MMNQAHELAVEVLSLTVILRLIEPETHHQIGHAQVRSPEENAGSNEAGCVLVPRVISNEDLYRGRNQTSESQATRLLSFKCLL